MLYLNAPGWPASIGSKSKARKHLERAVELAPDYPTNLLTLIDAYLEWEDEDAVQKAMESYRKLLPKARAIYAGAKWEQSWKDWDARWKKIIEKERAAFSE
jgi:Tfp pilus assembly protein PilF